MFLILVISYSQCVFAHVITVSNNPGQPAQYNNVTTALAAAQNGDTLYVFGSTVSYGEISITKPVTIIGSGINTARTAHARTTFSRIVARNGTGGITLSGIFVTRFNFENVTAAMIISNITVEYSFVSDFVTLGPNGVTYNNFLINNCIIGRLNLGDPALSSIMSNIIIKNSQISGVVGCKNVVYYNCMFGGGHLTDAANGIGGAIF